MSTGGLEGGDVFSAREPVKNSRARRTEQSARELFFCRLTSTFSGFFAAAGTYFVLNRSAAFFTWRTSTALTHFGTPSEYLGFNQLNRCNLRPLRVRRKSGMNLFFV